MNTTNTERWEQLQGIVARLRGTDGCPWDRAQTLESMRSCVLEECWEVIEAINRCDLLQLQEELGDLLLNILLLCDIAQQNKTGEAGKAKETFLDGLLARLCEKLVRRHPHVFGPDTAENAEQALAHWQKAQESEQSTVSETSEPNDSLLDKVAKAQPTLLYALKLQKKAAKAGLDWPKETVEAEIQAKIAEELAEFFCECQSAAPQKSRIEEELGDLLFVAVNLARVHTIDPELALGRSAEKFRRRFAFIVQYLQGENLAMRDCSTEQLDALWQKAKAELPKAEQTER